MINNIKNNTISETDAKQKLNSLDEIRKKEAKNKRLISSQKTLLNLFDDLLKTIFNNNNNNNNNESVNDNERVNDNESINDNESVNESESENKNKNVNDYENHKIRQINCCFKTIDKTKSFEEQIEILETVDFLDEYWDMNYCDDNKKLNFKIFKLKFSHIFNDVDDNLF